MYTINAATQRLIEAGILADPSYVPREKELNRFGVMVWDHKTGGSCQIMTGDSFSNANNIWRNLDIVQVFVSVGLEVNLRPSGEMVDTTDLKSVVRKDVPVRVRLWAPFIFQYYKLPR